MIFKTIRYKIIKRERVNKEKKRSKDSILEPLAFRDLGDEEKSAKEKEEISREVLRKPGGFCGFFFFNVVEGQRD